MLCAFLWARWKEEYGNAILSYDIHSSGLRPFLPHNIPVQSSPSSRHVAFGMWVLLRRSVPHCSASTYEIDFWSLMFDQTCLLLWFFDRVIWVFLFVSVFSFQCVLMLYVFKAAKTNIAVVVSCFLLILWHQWKTLFAAVFCLLCLCGCCLCTLCLCAYHCFFSSDLNKAWPGGNCPYQFIDYWSPWTSPPPTHVKHRTSCRLF